VHDVRHAGFARGPEDHDDAITRLHDALSQQDTFAFQRFLLAARGLGDLASIDAPAERQPLHRLVVRREGPNACRHTFAGEVPRGLSAVRETAITLAPASSAA
jgi:hypothetical protein